MNDDGLVEVPENALVEERIAFGLTAPQLGIVTAAVLLAAALNLAPLWAPLKVFLILVVAGPITLVATLPVRGEPAYRWCVRAFRYWRSAKVWNPGLEVSDPDKPLVSGGVVDPVDTSGEEVATLRERTTFAAVGSGPVDLGADNEPAAPRALAAPVPPLQVARGPSAVEERRPMNGSPARLRLLKPHESGHDEDAAVAREETERPPSVPFVLPGPRLVCFLSFAGGVGKTTLAVETATYIGQRARYRTPDNTAAAVRVLVIDAARLASAAGLRLGIGADDLSKPWAYRDWSEPESALGARVRTRHGVDLIGLPPHPQLLGLESGVPEDTHGDFRGPEANTLLDAARNAGYQLLVADLGSLVEHGHRVFLQEAAVVVGVVRPTLESLPDVLRVTNHLRNTGFARKLVLVANQCDDDAELRRFASDADVPVVAAVPPSSEFVAAADRQEPAWRADRALEAAILPLARTVWPLDSLGPEDRRRHGVGAVVARARALVGRVGR